MPPDRSPRPVRQFPSKPYDLSMSPSSQPPPKTSNTDGAGRLMVDSTSAFTAGETPPRRPLPVIISMAVADYQSSVPSQAGCVADTPIPIDVPPMPNLNRPQSSRSRLDDRRDHSPVHPPLQCERNATALSQATHTHIDAAIFHQHTHPHIAHSVVQPHPLHDRSHLTSYQYHQAGNASRDEVLLGLQHSPPHSPYPRLGESSSRLQVTSAGSFNQAHDFVINHPIFVDNSSDNFMASLLETTIKGAEFDSSDRHMPLRCHPGTRVNIIKRCQDFVLNREGRPRLRWVVGSAGVGKSAIMQSVAHDEFDVLSDVIVGATIFFSINGRQDGRKAITTIAYQLAVKIRPYRLFVQRKVTDNPSLLQKSLATQFKNFIIEPFIHQRILDHSTRLLIIIDGLDECGEISVQKELLGLISDFCIKYPTSPIVWVIASRPEPHITSFFSRPDIAFAYEKEEILVDTDEAREDVKHYLRDKFREIQLESITLQHLPQWPPQDDYLKVADASGGLLAYASTVVRYIGDPEYGNPVRLLQDVVTVIESGSRENRWGRNHPMAQLDALYSHIMSKIPANVMPDTRKLLLSTKGETIHILGPPPFLLVCNMLKMGENTAYSATHHIRAIAKVPRPTEAAKGRLEFFHKSFYDYLHDFERSGFSRDFDSEANQLFYNAALRVLEQAPDGVATDDEDSLFRFNSGELKNGPGTGESISLSWLEPEDDECALRFGLFCQAVCALLLGFRNDEKDFESLLHIRPLTTCFTRLPSRFPYDAVRNFTFHERRRREFLEHGILKQVPLPTITRGMTCDNPLRLRFRSPTVEQSNAWNANCRHERYGSWEDQSQDWSTPLEFKASDGGKRRCAYCRKRFFHHLETRQRGHLVTVLDLTPTESIVELQFVDPDDGVSDWTYHIFLDARYVNEDDEEDDDGDDEEEEDEDEEEEEEEEEDYEDEDDDD